MLYNCAWIAAPPITRTVIIVTVRYIFDRCNVYLSFVCHGSLRPRLVVSKSLTVTRVSPFPLLYRRNAWSSVVRKAQARLLCRIYLYDFRFFRFLQSPIPRDTNNG